MTTDSTSELSGPGSTGPDPLLGATLADRYLIESLIGRGGMGSVYLARQIELDRKVAIKVISHELAKSENAIERFRREAAATAKLRHPNIVTVYDFAALPDGRMYLVMELLGGPTLEKRLEEGGVFEPHAALETLRPVCRALSALHRSGVVHRDIKPSNIVLPDPEDPYDAVKVVDFGIARLRDAKGAKLTGKSILGTPEYLSPEVIEGDEADERTDIYSVGVIAYQMLAGQLPFTGSTSGAILLQHLTKTPKPPSALNAALGEAIDRAVLKALEKDRSDRFQSADEFGMALQSAIAPGTTGTYEIPTTAELHEPTPPAVSILLIDDDEDLRTVNRATLEGGGYRVVTAGDGIEALLKLGAETYDLVLSDVDMPNLDGFRLLEMASQKGIKTPVIFITGRVDAENEIRGLELGAEDYLRKPVLPALLLARVKATLSKRRT
jgi:serine/threonine protein kinase